MLEQMDGLAPFRNIVGFLGLLVVGKSVPDAVFAFLRHWAKIRGDENLDYGMLGADAIFALVGAGLIYVAVVFMAPPQLPPEFSDELGEES